MSGSVKIGNFELACGKRPIVIAEAGINHNGDVSLAKKLIHSAKECGADIIKFQTHLADAEMLDDRESKTEAGGHITKSLYEIMTECHLSKQDHLDLIAESKKVGIQFLSTPFSIEAVDLLDEIGMPAFKVGSGEVTNIPFLEHIASKNKPIILSTGTANWEEVGQAVTAISKSKGGFILLQCTSNYPTAYENVNVKVMDKMRDAFDCPVGLSDHCTGNYAAFAAVAREACLVEKHFTISRDLPGPDQSSSMEPHELKELVEGIKAIYATLGDKKILNEEAMKVRNGFSESVVTLKAIKAGESFNEKINVWVKRPGTGIPSYDLPKVIGKKATRDLPANYLLSPKDIAEFA